MRGTIVTLFCVTALVSAATINVNHNGCPLDFNLDKLLPHENCNQFYQCSFGRLVTLVCPKGLFFNSELQQCDWPHNVNCIHKIATSRSVRDAKKVNSDPSEAPAICKATGADGVLVAHEKCNQFYKCSHGKPVALNCPLDLLYSPEFEYCDWPKDVDCGNRAIPEQEDKDVDSIGDVEKDDVDSGNNDQSINDDPGQSSAICAREGSDGIIVAHENCTQFYKCSEGSPVALKCPHQLLYNPKNEQCDWPQNVICGDRVIPDDKDNGGNGDGNGDSNDGNDGNDGDHTVNDTCNCNPSEAPEICAKPNSNGVLVAHEKCTKFYKCSYGLPVALKCPPNLLYNPYHKVCDWPKNVQCGDRVIPEDDDEGNDGGHGDGDGNGNEDDDEHEDEDIEEDDNSGNSDPSEAPAICAAKESDGILIAHELCNYFYICLHSRPLPVTCPVGLHFNPKNKQCDWPKNVNCSGRIISAVKYEKLKDTIEIVIEKEEIHSDPSKAPEICAAKDSDSILVAHEKCNKFYSCSGGVPVALRCPKGLLYNPREDECGWPDAVDCGGRVIPNGDDDDDDDDDCDKDDDGQDFEGNDDPSKAPEICKEEGSDGILVAHEYCNEFYICVNSRPVAMKCPKSLLYNPKVKECDWPQNVECKGRVIPKDEV